MESQISGLALSDVKAHQQLEMTPGVSRGVWEGMEVCVSGQNDWESREAESRRFGEVSAGKFLARNKIKWGTVTGYSWDRPYAQMSRGLKSCL